MKRRDFIKLSGAVGLASLPTQLVTGKAAVNPADIVVVGAGVFGIWTAWHLHHSGHRVTVVDAVGPAHSGASSGGESRVTRSGYGAEDIYTEWAHRSMFEWRALSERAALPLFHETGVLWLHNDGDPLIEATRKTLTRHDIDYSIWTAQSLRKRFPVIAVKDSEAGFYEPQGGGLMARRAVQQLAAELSAAGVQFVQGQIKPISATEANGGILADIEAQDGQRIRAEQFVMCCGPWLDKVCPEAMENRLFATRQDIVYFGGAGNRTGSLPTWADLPFYGLPSLEGRGFKVANDTHGERVDVDQLQRVVSPQTITQARDYLAVRFPSLADSPVSETRVCQYENSSNGDFVIDRHTGLKNVWIAGCGSGHGFKHGPAIGAHIAGLVQGTEKLIPRFSVASKKTSQQRAIQ